MPAAGKIYLIVACFVGCSLISHAQTIEMYIDGTKHAFEPVGTQVRVGANIEIRIKKDSSFDPACLKGLSISTTKDGNTKQHQSQVQSNRHVPRNNEIQKTIAPKIVGDNLIFAFSPKQLTRKSDKSITIYFMTAQGCTNKFEHFKNFEYTYQFNTIHA